MRFWVLALAVALAGCATGSTSLLVDRKITEPKVVALDAPQVPWVDEIEGRLREHGFQVIRWTAQGRTGETTPQRAAMLQQAPARYVVVIEGSAPLNFMLRCLGGGYNFEGLTAELVDVKTSQTILRTSGSGFSERCPPLSGTIFSDIASAVAGAWQ